jgi:hypothetical protein
MARPIVVVPVLTGAAARRFDRRAAEMSKRKHTIDVSEQMKIADKIIADARAHGEDV